MTSGFYGNDINLYLPIDKIYPNYTAAQNSASSDDIFLGRYVLINYNFNEYGDQTNEPGAYDNVYMPNVRTDENSEECSGFYHLDILRKSLKSDGTLYYATIGSLNLSKLANAGTNKIDFNEAGLEPKESCEKYLDPDYKNIRLKVNMSTGPNVTQESEFTINIPELGNAISKMWDVVFDRESKDSNKRKTDLSRAGAYSNKSYSANTLAGCLGHCQRLLGYHCFYTDLDGSSLQTAIDYANSEIGGVAYFWDSKDGTVTKIDENGKQTVILEFPLATPTEKRKNSAGLLAAACEMILNCNTEFRQFMDTSTDQFEAFMSNSNTSVNNTINRGNAAAKSLEDLVNTTGGRGINVGMIGVGDDAITQGEIFNSYGGSAPNTATGIASHAEGQNTTASEDRAHAEGYGTIASGEDSHAEGNCTNASATGAHAEGIGPRVGTNVFTANTDYGARGIASHAEGEFTTAIGRASHAEGYQTQATGVYSHSEGGGSQAKGESSHAEGGSCIAEGSGSHAEGWGSEAEGTGAHAEGKNTTAKGKDSLLGDGAHAEGSNTQAYGEGAHAEGYGTLAQGNNAHAEGNQTKAKNSNTHAEGYMTEAFGLRSHAEGSQGYAYGEASHVEGTSSNKANIYNENGDLLKDDLINVNWDNKKFSLALGKNSHVEGEDSYAFGTASHAEGYQTRIFNMDESGAGAHAEGYRTIAQGIAAHAEGYNTTANGNYTHAAGIGTETSAEAQYVVGKYNKLNVDALFIVGNGSNDDEDYRSNAFVVNQNGEAEFSGNVKADGKLLLSALDAYNTYLSQTDASNNYAKLSGENTFSGNQTINGAFAQGSGCIAGGQYSHAEGVSTETKGPTNDNKTNGLGSHAEGRYTYAEGLGAHAEGNGDADDRRNIASGIGAHCEGYLTSATGQGAHAEGRSTIANGDCSHAEGQSSEANAQSAHAEGGTKVNSSGGLEAHKTTASGVSSHAEGAGTTASGHCSHAEGSNTLARGPYSHAEGYSTLVETYARGGHAEGGVFLDGTKETYPGTNCYGVSAHAEGVNTRATGNYSHVEGESTFSFGQGSHAEGFKVEAFGQYSHAEGESSSMKNCNNFEDASELLEAWDNYSVNSLDDLFLVSYGKGSHAEGCNVLALGDYSHAEGLYSRAIGDHSHAEGRYSTAGSFSKIGAHAEGNSTRAIGNYSHAEGQGTQATADNSHAEGALTKATANAAHAEGNSTEASGLCSHAGGHYTVANGCCQTVIGYYDAWEGRGFAQTSGDQNGGTTLFAIGNGTGITSTKRSNAFRFCADGTAYSSKTFSSGGADFAEYFEWEDGNFLEEDRRGLFVTLKDDKICLANSNNEYILGVVTSSEAFVCNSASENWHEKYLTDIFGEKIIEKIKIPEIINEQTGEIEQEATIIEQWVINPNYDSEKTYISRKYRKEWSPIGLCGQVVVVDDGTCEVNGYCYPGQNGVGTKSDKGYRVMKRLDDTHIKVLIK